MRIAMICHNYPPHPGGLEVMVSALSARLAARHDVTVITSAFGGRSGITRERAVTVVRLPAVHASERGGVPYPVPVGAGVAAAMRLTARADVVHAHGALYAHTLLGLAVARARRRPVVLTEHVGFVEYRRESVNLVQKAAWRTVGDSVVRHSAAIVACSVRVQKWLADRSGRAVQYIGNGVDLDVFRPADPARRKAARVALGLPADPVLALFVGRSSEKKNLDAVLRFRREHYTLVVCGADRNLRGDRLIDLGLLPYHRMPELFAAADMMIHAATGEGFPIAIQEAVASGVPLVVLWDPGYAGSVTRDVVVACDELRELGEAANELAREASTRARLRAVGRTWAESRWSWRQTTDEYEEVYREVCAAQRDR